MQGIEGIRKLLEEGGKVEQAQVAPTTPQPQAVPQASVIGVPPTATGAKTLSLAEVMFTLRPSMGLFSRTKDRDKLAERLWEKFTHLYERLVLLAWNKEINAYNGEEEVDLAEIFKKIYKVEPPVDTYPVRGLRVVDDESYKEVIRNASKYFGRGYGVEARKAKAGISPEYVALKKALEEAIRSLSEDEPEPRAALASLLEAYHGVAMKFRGLPKVELS